MRLALIWVLGVGALVFACGGDDEEAPAVDAALAEIGKAQSIQFAALFDDSYGAAFDAGSADAGVPRMFHGAKLMSGFIEIPMDRMAEITQVLASPDSYMPSPNACFDRDLAVRVVTPRRVYEISMGLTCANVSFDGRTEYMYDQPLFRIAALAHELIPYVDANQVLE
jgi:hypothetical protein